MKIIVNDITHEIKVLQLGKQFELTVSGTNTPICVTLPNVCSCEQPWTDCEHVLAVLNWINDQKKVIKEAEEWSILALRYAEEEKTIEAVVEAETAFKELKAARLILLPAGN
jgi:hypothetical protein